ncbi:hypothetical protein HPB50_004818 [Hyalomma asiaticum]|uniref:Uncharacterized protein n=1 Tax=Hyalomma asiaticum TaxID=266040 RepID=A0ACB7SMU5_HYAAI|nr:hypothetical protein HPB50_004818 [Hyalomma asiaticum]
MVGRESPPAGVPGNNDESQIARFYQDQVVFITGGTSFIGKVLLEKLLRSCSVLRVYLLVRNQHGLEADERLEAMLSTDMFQRVRLEAPEALGRVKAVAGDISLPGLGLSDTDKQTLIEQVSVVFHLAATIRPDETFKYDNEEATEPAKKLLIGQPNNYILTNAVIESLLLDERGQLPLAIVRPSIVTASWKDPFPLGLGLLPSMILRNNCVADIIPVDVAADTLICVAWQIAVTRPTYLRVYNCTSSALKPHTWGEIIKELRRTMGHNPLSNAGSLPKFTVTSSHVLHRLTLYCLCFVPELLKKLGLRRTGRQSSFTDRYDKAIKATNAVQLYTTNSWLFRSNNVVGLINDLSPTDKQLFNIDVRKLEWCQYWDHYVQGIRKFLFKTDDAELAGPRKLYGRLSGSPDSARCPKTQSELRTPVSIMANTVPRQHQNLASALDDEKKDKSKVAQFYNHRVVFITGGTGFIGKMFNCLRQTHPDAFGKVTALAGDLTEPNLGLSASDQAVLVDSVSVVFHSGATVRFDEPLRQVKPLSRALVHVSTAYCKCDEPDVREMIYPAPINAGKLIESAQSSKEDETDSSKDCLYGHPNTYTLTKGVAESMLLEERGDIPVAIVRPSIVTASIREPLPVREPLPEDLQGDKLNTVRWSFYLAFAVVPCGIVAKTTTWDMRSPLHSFAEGISDIIGFQWLL